MTDNHTEVVFPESIENGLEQGSSPPFHHMRTQDNLHKTKNNPSPVTKSAGSLILNSIASWLEYPTSAY